MAKDFKVGDRVIGKTKAVKSRKGIVSEIIREDNKRDRYTIKWSDDSFGVVSSTAIEFDPDFVDTNAPAKKKRKLQPESTTSADSTHHVHTIPHPQGDETPSSIPVIFDGKNLAEDEENGW